MSQEQPYDALLLVSFGGPERAEQVLPFLKNVVRGRGVPEARLRQVAEHYLALGGKSPINDQCRALLSALRRELDAQGMDLPLYWGNRNWHPYVSDALTRMRADGVGRALAFVTSAYSSYSGCRQYLESIERAREEVGAGAPEIHKLRGFFNHPDFVETMIERTRQALAQLPRAVDACWRLVFTAHSIPNVMAQCCRYEAQLHDAAQLVASAARVSRYDLVYQSRSGPPQVPWLEPDILTHLRSLAAEGVRDVVLVPLGFVSDHMEVIWDLDHEAQALASELGLNLVRASTAGTHPRFVAMIRKLVNERVSGQPARASCGTLAPLPDVCPVGCCPPR